MGGSSGPRSRGSPPRGRGKAQADAKKKAEEGITPAWAGKRYGSGGPSMQRRDHPRVGGEKGRNKQNCKRLRGSPPRGRGKVCELLDIAAPRGITPAWAGKSPPFGLIHPKTMDHPRVGGEKALMPTNALVVKGSPPRGRGKVPCILPEVTRQGITPAWAGKSFCFNRTKRSI